MTRFWSCESYMVYTLDFPSYHLYSQAFPTHFCCYFALQGSIKFSSYLFAHSELVLFNPLLLFILNSHFFTPLIRSSSLHLLFSPHICSSLLQLSETLFSNFFNLCLYSFVFYPHFNFLSFFFALCLSSPTPLLITPLPASISTPLLPSY